ncbi:uncharacterized protein [Rutidosis leptorrhynchoides]|uniref:uncharacterized protein n=1 Tax=Rutidosis leptorrhynchoides TaxID=125765 RepID=UPI003A98EB43
MLGELIEWYKKKNRKLLIFKVDFDKAFDSVNWIFLDFSLAQLGFGQKWRKWMRACLTSGRSSVLINGSPTSEFSLKCGLRQVDPLSPYLFIIVMEGLHYAFQRAISNNVFHGVNVGNVNVSHFLFADDVAIVSYWNEVELDAILLILNRFYLESGLKINLHKSNLIGIGVSQDEVELMSTCTGCTALHLIFLDLNSALICPDRALGPLSLISSKIDYLRVLASRDKGGLGISSLKSFNCTLLLKWVWRSVHSVGAIWVQLLKAIHGEKLGIDIRGCKTKGIWHAIVTNYLSCQASGALNPVTLTRKRVATTDCFVLNSIRTFLFFDRVSGPTWAWSRTPSGTSHLDSLIAELQSVTLTDHADRWTWNLDVESTFTLCDTRLFLDNFWLPSHQHSTWLFKVIPIKVNVFMWRLRLDRLPTRLNLSSRGIDIESIVCPICGLTTETHDHTFLSCEIASTLWNRVRLWMDPHWPTFSTIEELFDWILSRYIHTSRGVKVLCIISTTL